MTMWVFLLLSITMDKTKNLRDVNEFPLLAWYNNAVTQGSMRTNMGGKYVKINIYDEYWQGNGKKADKCWN